MSISFRQNQLHWTHIVKQRCWMWSSENPGSFRSQSPTKCSGSQKISWDGWGLFKVCTKLGHSKWAPLRRNTIALGCLEEKAFHTFKQSIQWKGNELLWFQQLHRSYSRWKPIWPWCNASAEGQSEWCEQSSGLCFKVTFWCQTAILTDQTRNSGNGVGCKTFSPVLVWQTLYSHNWSQAIGKYFK